MKEEFLCRPRSTFDITQYQYGSDVIRKKHQTFIFRHFPFNVNEDVTITMIFSFDIL